MFSRIRALVGSLLLLVIVGSCGSVYWKRFVVDEGTDAANPELAINLGSFKMSFFVNVGGEPPNKIADSIYNLSVQIKSLHESKQRRMEFAKSFILNRLIAESDDPSTLAAHADVVGDTIYYTTRVIDFERLLIPEAVDTLRLHLWYEYLSDDEQMIIDSTIVRLVRSEGHYTVPLGRFMN